MTKLRTHGVVVGTVALALAAVPALAQDDAEMMAEPIEVGGVEYAFTDLPTSVPAGTEVTLRNDGVEVHEIFIMRVADDVTESFEELMGMGEEAMAAGKVVPVSEAPLIVMPGETSEGSIALPQEGRHVAICFVPQGVIPEDLAALGITDLGPDMDVSGLSPEAQEYVAALDEAPPHFVLGMVQEFTVTAAGTEVGPLPEPMEDEAA